MEDSLDSENMCAEQDSPAGAFGLWLKEMRESLQGKRDADVLCGECVACCTSSYFIHLKPSDIDARKHIPKALVFSAPGMPKGHALLGYDEHGHCPMFIENKCSIYAHRPQTCRQYDCRVFPATGLTANEEGKVLIAKQAKRWKFDFPSEQDCKEIAAVKAAAKFLNEYTTHFPDGFVPSNTTQQAVVAIEVYEVFLGLDDNAKSIEELVEAVVSCLSKSRIS